MSDTGIGGQRVNQQEWYKMKSCVSAKGSAGGLEETKANQWEMQAHIWTSQGPKL
jgi:hypothetical protein